MNSRGRETNADVAECLASLRATEEHLRRKGEETAHFLVGLKQRRADLAVALHERQAVLEDLRSKLGMAERDRKRPTRSLPTEHPRTVDELRMSVRLHPTLPVRGLAEALLDRHLDELGDEQRLHLTLAVRVPQLEMPAHVHLRAPVADLRDRGVRQRFLGELWVAYKQLSGRVAADDARHGELALRLHVEPLSQPEVPCDECGVPWDSVPGCDKRKRRLGHGSVSYVVAEGRD